MTGVTEESVWHAYYDAFPYINKDDVRPFCHPRKLLHPDGSDRSIILIHGLSDSPYSVLAIGNYFHHDLGYDVYLPLLQCHGFNHANGMRGVKLDAWKKNIQFAIEVATQRDCRVSIGGLSTGGALAFHFIVQDRRLGGELYLFSAAFGLYGGKKNILSPIIEGFLKLPFVPLLTTGCSLIDENPYRYKRVPLVAGRELAFLMVENQVLLKEIAAAEVFPTKVFSAWSDADRVVRTDLLADFEEILIEGCFESFVVPKRVGVSHAGVVLAEHVYGVNSSPDDPPVENANPYFNLMMDSMARFENVHRLD
ncbi:alpha/beta hydrolase [Desulforhopalus sp. 52FAK]